MDAGEDHAAGGDLDCIQRVSHFADLEETYKSRYTEVYLDGLLHIWVAVTKFEECCTEAAAGLGTDDTGCLTYYAGCLSAWSSLFSEFAEKSSIPKKSVAVQKRVKAR